MVFSPYKLLQHPVMGSHICVVCVQKLVFMIAAINRKKGFPVIIMLIVLIGMTASVMGQTSSHGVPELTGATTLSEGDHSHGQKHHNHTVQDEHDRHSHHDPGNHSHESADRLTLPIFSDLTPSLRRPVPLAGENPRSFCYRLDRPPKLRTMI